MTHDIRRVIVTAVDGQDKPRLSQPGRRACQLTLALLLMSGILGLLMAGCARSQERRNAEASLTAAVGTATAVRQTVTAGEATLAAYGAQVEEARRNWEETRKDDLNRQTLLTWCGPCIAILIVALLVAAVMPGSMLWVMIERVQGKIAKNRAELRKLDAEQEELDIQLGHDSNDPPFTRPQ